MSCKRGFTLIELLVVVLIIGILASIALPAYRKAVEKSKASQALILLKALGQAQDAYYLTEGKYAKKFSDLDVDMSAWTGTTQWRTSANDTRSNNEWSLQLFNQSTNGNAVYLDRISGPYKGVGFMYWVNRPDESYPLRTIVCHERNNYGITFDGNTGDYCQKIMGYVKDPTTKKWVAPIK